MLGMSVALNPPHLLRPAYRLSVDFYQQLGDLGMLKQPCELIRGIIYNKMSKTPLHGILARKLFHKILALMPPGFTLRFDEPLALHDSVPEPELAIVQGSDEHYTRQHPRTAELVVEVAVTSLADDRSLASVYAEADVKEYWIVIAQERQIEVYRQPVDGHYQERRLYSAVDCLACSSIPSIQLIVSELFEIAV